MLRLLLTILAVYLVLLLLQSTICRGVNNAIMSGYWWMCGDVAGTATNNGRSQGLNPLVLLQQAQQAFRNHDYFPPAGLRLPLAQADYIFSHWCWKGVL